MNWQLLNDNYEKEKRFYAIVHPPPKRSLYNSWDNVDDFVKEDRRLGQQTCFPFLAKNIYGFYSSSFRENSKIASQKMK